MFNRINILSLVAVALVMLGCQEQRSVDYPLASPNLTQVKLLPGFWKSRQDSNRNVTIPHSFAQCETHGLIDNFAIAAGLKEGQQGGVYPFDDTDVYKTIEGASYWLAMENDPTLDAYVDSLIGLIATAQEPDGYIYTARKNRPDWTRWRISEKRWENLVFGHELYNFGHLYEAAFAHFQSTGKRSLLDVALKNADLVLKTFGPNGIHHPTGHQEIEIGLVKLYRVTGNIEYLHLAEFFLEQRGRSDNGRKLMDEYAQDHKPILEQTEAVGHAVRQAYMNMAMLDVSAASGDMRWFNASKRLWENVVTQKWYITGGLGAVGFGERFGKPFELPNFSAYQETCASIANVMWNDRLFRMSGDAKYLDVLERTLYNALLSGISVNGDLFFYPNVLASKGYHERFPWFTCNCCITNLSRFMPVIGNYIYATRGDQLFINQFINSSLEMEMSSEPLRLSQHSNYPYDGKIRIDIEAAGTFPVELRVRIPGWADNRPVPGDLYRFSDTSETPVKMTLNGEEIVVKAVDGFAVIRRVWQSGDQLTVNLPMPVRRILASETLAENTGKVALQRGPLVFCLEGADQSNGKTLDKVLPADATFSVENDKTLPAGAPKLVTEGISVERDNNGRLNILTGQPIVAIPYFAWAHRGMTEMNVWIPIMPNGAIASGNLQLAQHAKIIASNADGAVHLSDGSSTSGYFHWNERKDTLLVEYRFDQIQPLSFVGVQWYENPAKGIKVPQKWRAQVLVENKWETVFSPYGEWGISAGKMNRVIFETGTSDAIRLEIIPQTNAICAIAEWQVD